MTHRFSLTALVLAALLAAPSFAVAQILLRVESAAPQYSLGGVGGITPFATPTYIVPGAIPPVTFLPRESGTQMPIGSGVVLPVLQASTSSGIVQNPFINNTEFSPPIFFPRTSGLQAPSGLAGRLVVILPVFPSSASPVAVDDPRIEPGYVWLPKQSPYTGGSLPVVQGAPGGYYNNPYVSQSLVGRPDVLWRAPAPWRDYRYRLPSRPLPPLQTPGWPGPGPFPPRYSGPWPSAPFSPSIPVQSSPGWYILPGVGQFAVSGPGQSSLFTMPMGYVGAEDPKRLQTMRCLIGCS